MTATGNVQDDIATGHIKNKTATVYVQGSTTIGNIQVGTAIGIFQCNNTYFTLAVPTALSLQCNWPITGSRRIL